jgi:hypothetical protein
VEHGSHGEKEVPAEDRPAEHEPPKPARQSKKRKGDGTDSPAQEPTPAAAKRGRVNSKAAPKKKGSRKRG